MRGILITLLSLAIVIAAITFYLGPNDLALCGATPNNRPGCQTANAIVAISGGDTTARTNEAIKLYKAGWASTLVFSGAAADKSGPSNAAIMERTALRDGVPSSAILIDPNSDTTAQNASNTNTILEQHSITSIILVTSAYHQRRASLEFHALAPTISIRNHPVASDDQWSIWWWLTPQGWYLAGSELVKIVAFYIGGAR